MKKLALILLSLFGMVDISNGQTNPYQDHWDYYDQIDSALVPNGYLFNRGFITENQLQLLNNFSPMTLPQTNEELHSVSIMDGETWIRTYNAIYNSKMGPVNTMPSIEDISAYIENDSASSNQIPLMMFQYDGEFWNRDAVDDAINGTSSKTLNSVIGSPSSYMSQSVHTFGVVGLDNYSYSGDVDFKMDLENYYFSNVEDPDAFYIDFDDGSGEQLIPFQTQVIPVTYTTAGDKVINVYALYIENSDTLIKGSTFTFEVISVDGQTSTLGGQGQKVSNVAKANITQVPGASISVVHSEDDLFDRPFIVLHGFDPTGEESTQAMFERYNEIYTNELRPFGYDLVLVELSNKNQAIQNNVAVLKNAIQAINNAKEDGPFEATMIGESMGGILTRAALKELENDGIDHEVGLYISFDSPHQGAEIPVGLQHALVDLNDVDVVNFVDITFPVYKHFAWALSLHKKVDINDEVGSIREALSLLETAENALKSGAGQELLYINIFDPDRSNYLANQNYLNALGYPSDSRNVALINGSNNGDIPQTIFGDDLEPGDKLINFNSALGANCNRLDVNVWSAIENGTQTVSQMELRISAPDVEVQVGYRWECTHVQFGCMKLFGKTRCLVDEDVCVLVPQFEIHADACLPITNKSNSMTFTNEIPYDVAPGSFTASGFDSEAIESDFTFIPTISSVDVDQTVLNGQPRGGMYRITSEFALDNMIINDQTPFDDIYSSDDNTWHVWLGQDNNFQNIIDWEVMPEDLFLTDRTVSLNRRFRAQNTVRSGDHIDFSGRIIGNDGFTVEDGTVVTIDAGDEVRMSPGTHLESGSNVHVSIYNPTSGAKRSSTGKKSVDSQHDKLSRTYILGKKKYCFLEEITLSAAIKNESEALNYTWKLLDNSSVYYGENIVIDGALLPGVHKIRLEVTDEDFNVVGIAEASFMVNYFGHECGGDYLKGNEESDDAISTALFEKSNISIYPNPSSGVFFIEASNTETSYDVSVIDQYGVEVWRGKLNAQPLQVNLSSQPAGMYFISSNSGEENFIDKIIIE